MTYTIEELFLIIKKSPITEEKINNLRNRLIKQSKEKDPTIPIKEFLGITYSI